MGRFLRLECGSRGIFGGRLVGVGLGLGSFFCRRLRVRVVRLC